MEGKINLNNRVFVFIDASNIWQAQKAKGRFLDYEKIKNYLKKEFQTKELKIYYYTAYPAEGTREYSLDGKHKFYVYLEKGLGYQVVKKALKRIIVINEHGQSIKEKGNMDVEIAIDAVRNLADYDIAVFFTGDSDFLALVVYLMNKGKKVYVFSSKNNISEELKTGGNGYYDLLKDVKEDVWGNELKYRASKT